MTSRYIAIDWGSTNLRAWLYQGEQCLESRQSEAGVTRVEGRALPVSSGAFHRRWRAVNVRWRQCLDYSRFMRLSRR